MFYILILFEGSLYFGQCCRRLGIIVLMPLRSNTFSFIVLDTLIASVAFLRGLRP